MWGKKESHTAFYIKFTRLKHYIKEEMQSFFFNKPTAFYYHIGLFTDISVFLKKKHTDDNRKIGGYRGLFTDFINFLIYTKVYCRYSKIYKQVGFIQILSENKIISYL